MKTLTDFRKTVETGVDPRLESVKFKTKHELSHKPVTCLLSL